MYEIDPEHNQGLDFQYDEVVRDKEKRKRMHAGDCECCREVRDSPPRALLASSVPFRSPVPSRSTTKPSDPRPHA